MKPTKLIGILLFLILSVTANAISVTGYGVTPSTIKVGENYKFYMNFDSNLPSNYDVRLSTSSSGSSAQKMRGGQRKWYVSGKAGKVTTVTLYFHLFKDGKHEGYLKRSARLTVKSASPTVSSVSIPTLTKDISSKIKFYGSNFISGMAFTIADASCNSAVTKSSSTYAYIYCTPRASGSKNWVIKDRSGGNALKRGTVTVKAPTPPKPTLSGGVNIVPITGGFKINCQNASGQTRYEFYRSTSSGSLGSRIYSNSSRYYEDKGLTHNTTYWYTAKACNSSGCTTSGQNYRKYLVPKPVFNSGVSIKSITNGLSLRWNSATGSGISYRLYRSTSSSSWGGQIYSGTALTRNDTSGLVDGTKYYYRVKACNVAGCTDSRQDSFVYVTPDNKPTMSVKTFSSTVDKSFTSKIEYRDDKGLQRISYKIYTNGNTGGSPILKQTLNISGKSYTKNWSINTTSLADGKYEIMFFVADGKNPVQEIKRTFTKKGDKKPTISIKSFPTTVDKSLSSKIEYKDDKALKRISYKIYTNGNTGGSPILEQTLNISGTSYTKNWSINTTSLADGKYEIMFFVSDEKTGVQSVTKTFTKKSAKPIVNTFKPTPTTPKMFEPITFTAISDIATSNVKFKCGGGNWQPYSSVSNGNKTWSYIRDVGLKSTTNCYVDIDGDENSDKTITVTVGDPKFVIGKSNNSPREGDKVTFSVSTDKIESGYKLQVKFSSNGSWNDMTPASDRKSWTKDRIFESKGDKTVYFQILNPSGNKIYDTTTTITVGEASVSAIVSYLNQDDLVKQMSLDSNDDNPLSRSDAIVLIDRMRALGKSSIDKNMQEYYNPFADVPSDAEYLPSLMRLAYYKSNFDVTTINKTTLFNPMHHTTREEFVKMAMNGFDIPEQSYDLSAFSDRDDMSDWATKYFQTAVANKIIVGNSGKLLARDEISIKEALIILRRVKDKFSSNYPFTESRYETPESLDISSLYHKTIGFEYEPRYYKPDATPIDITAISKSKNENYYVLTVNSTIDTANGASDYYWWSTDKGYFKEVGTDGNYKTVHFYPMSSEPSSDYHITVNGGDNLGYEDSYSLTIKKGDFSYPEDNKSKDVLPLVTENLDGVSLGSKLIANKLFTVDLSAVSVKKSNIELGVDQVMVIMEYDKKTYQLFYGTPNAKKARFVMGDYPDLYGKTVTLRVEIYSQAKKYKTSTSITYKPQFTVRGKVYNALDGTKVTSVMVGSTSVTLDENGEFYHTLDRDSEIRGLEIKTAQNSEQNHFDPINVDLTYQSPSRYVVLTGEDARPSLNLTVSPIHVPSNESVKFTLTSNENIPSNATIDLEEGSCNAPSGLGSKKVEITCTTATTDDIKHILMSINSSELYGGGLTRTVVVDRALNDADEIERVKNQLSIPSSADEDIDLPTEMLGVTISWSSSDPSVISNSGVVTQQDSEQSVVLTATLSKDSISDTKEFTVTVPAKEDSVVDTDGDGIPDSEDLDDDGISDVDELKYKLDPLDPNDANYDSDGDGVSNIEEIRSGTDPRDDTDYPDTGVVAEYEFAETGHRYFVYDTKLSWKEAKTFCEERDSHLATITSEAENRFIESWVSTLSRPYYWLGGTDEEVEGTWKWVTGEAWSYENWNSGEPNDQNGEDYLHLYRDHARWNDLPVNPSNNLGLICEKSIDKVELDRDLVAHYEFEGNANDSSGNDNHGTEHGGVSYVDGAIGKAGSFDGVDDYINLGHSEELSFGGKKAFSISLYMKQVDSYGALVSKFNGHVIGEYMLFTEKHQDIIFHREVNPWELKSDEDVIKNNQFYHIVATYDGETMKLYLNNKLISSEKRGSQNTALDIDVLIGSRFTNSETGWFFNGLIDDVRIYNRALNESEIKELYDMADKDAITDTDHDGLSDKTEKALGLNIDSNDTDGDGYLDGEEVGDIDNPTDTDSDGVIDALDEDSDNDGVSDRDERIAGTDPRDENDYPNNTTKKLKWRAFVSSNNNYIEEDEQLSEVIKNGVIKIDPSLSNKSYYWTNFYLDLPKVLDGDNIKFETRVKCPSSEGGLSAYDTRISVLGSVDKDTNKSAWLTLMDGNWAQSYDSFGAEDTSIRNIPELVKDLQQWHSISVQTKNGKVSVYYDNQLLKESDYTGSVGKVIQLRISFKGSGTLDWAKLYQNDKLVLEENFDVDGKTTATLNIGECAQIITKAYNPTTGEEREFPTPCDVPNDWIVGDAPDFDGDGKNDIVDSDDDNDGISDTDEIKYGFNPKDPSDATQDSDGDGVSNIDEIKAGTNPTIFDGNPITISTQETITLKKSEEYNLSIEIDHKLQDNLYVTAMIDNETVATLLPQWEQTEPLDFDWYQEDNLTLNIIAKAVGESNLTIRIKDEDNQEVTKTINLSVLEKNANTIIDIRQPNWTIYTGSTEATIKNVYDINRGRQVIELNGTGLHSGYMLGSLGGWGNPNAWNNRVNKKIKWSMKYSEKYIIYISVQTQKGHRLLSYTNSDSNNGISFGTIHHGLGQSSSNGTWQTFTRDLEADLKEFEPDNNITSIDAFLIRGSGYIDNIILLDNLNPNLPKVLIANAGEDKIITFGESVTLDASGSSNGDIVSYSWVGSDGNNIGDEATLTLDSLSVGTHTFTVTVTDNDENTATDSVTIVVKDAICPEITKISSYDTTNTALDMILSKDGKKAYVVGETALTILDMSDKSNPKLINSYNISAKSVTLSNDEKIAYVLVDGALKILDINDSRHLEVLSSYNTSAKSVIVSDESKIAYLPNDAFLDINDSRHPKLLNSEIYNSSYNKTINGKKLYIFDEEFGAIKIFDISDASHPKYIDYIAFGNDDYYYDFPMDVTFSDDGKRAYLSAVQEPRYSSSSERANYKSIIGIDHNGYGTIFETLNNPLPVEKGLSNDGRTIYITDESTDDLKIFDTWGKLLGTYYTDAYILNVTLSKDDKVAYIVDVNGLKILDVSNKANPKFISSYSEATDKIKKVTLSNDEKTAYILYENGNLVLLDISDFKNLSNLNPSCFDKFNRPNHPILLDSYSLGEAIVEYNTYEYFKQSIRDVILSSDKKKIYIIKDIIESSADFEHDYSYLEVIDVSDSIHLKPLYDYYDRSNDSSCTDDDFCKDNISPIIDSVIENDGEREANSGTLSNGKNFYEIYVPDESDPYASSKDIRISIFGLPSY